MSSILTWPEPPDFIFFLGLILVLFGLYVAALPVGECDEGKCDHCRRRRLERAGKRPD